MANTVSGRVDSKMCQPCSRKDTRKVANIFCKGCGEFQCKDCAKGHEIYPVMSKHELVDAKAARDVASNYTMKGLDQCEKHHMLLEYFCEDENEPCCGKCAIVSHRKCNHVTEIETIAGLRKIDFSGIQRNMAIIEENAKTVGKHVTSARDKITKDASEIKDKIQTMQDKVMTVFDNLKKSVANDIDAFKEQVFDDLDTKMSIVDSFIADVKQTLAEIQAVSEQGSPAQQLIMVNHFKNRCAELKRKSDKAYVELRNVVLKFDFDISLILPPAKKTKPGKLTMSYDKGAEISSDTVVSKEAEQQVVLKLLKSIESNYWHVKYTGFDFLPDGRLVAVDNMQGRCLVFNQNKEEINYFQLSFWPHGVAAVSDDQVAITSGRDKTIAVLEISKQNTFTLVRKSEVSSHYESVSVIDEDNILMSSHDDSQPVRVESIRGQASDLDIRLSAKTYPSYCKSSACTYIRKYNKVVFSDKSADKVFIYDITNNTRVEVKNENIIKEPSGVVVGPGDSIFVCSKGTHSIVQLSHTGRIIYSHMLEMQDPEVFGVSKDFTRMVVSNSRCYDETTELQLYSIDCTKQ